GEQVSFSLAADGSVARLRFLGMDFTRAAVRLDYDRLAAKIVDALKLEGGERVVALYDPNVLAGLLSPLKSRIRSLAALRVEEAGNLDAADVLLMLPLASGNARVPAIPAWIDKGGARRAIHFHWADGTRRTDGLAGEHSAGFDALYQDALDVDYRMMAARQQRAIEILRSGTARVRTPAGTDFMFRVGARPFNRQLGDASAAAMRTARIRVDRDIELPAGVLRVAPVEESASGVIVIPEARFGETVAKKIALQIDNGRITRIRAEAGQQAVEAALAAGGPAAMSFREFGLGFNPKLMPAAGSSIMPYYGYGAGVIRLSLGDNEELGGNVRGGFARWFFFADATVHVDGKYLVRDGRLE
ncbi:MAG: hypothetical protein ACRD8O_02270, partial [Bryobacteraceae bacterium]